MEKYSHLIKNNPEIVDFFVYFSRFEFALKSIESSRAKKNDGSVDANWDGFAKEYKEKLLAFTEVEKSFSYLLNNPPKKRPYSGTDWVAVNHFDKPDYLKICLYIKTVRNNLFHGDKFDVLTEIGSVEQKRDLELVQHSLGILKAWVSLPGLKGLF